MGSPRAVEYPRLPTALPHGTRPHATHTAQVRSFDSHRALMENSRLRLLSETQKTQLEEKLKHQKRRRHRRLAVDAPIATPSLSLSPHVHESWVVGGMPRCCTPSHHAPLPRLDWAPQWTQTALRVRCAAAS